MYDIKNITILVAGLLATACSTQDSFEEYVEGGDPAEDMVYDGGDQIVVPSDQATPEDDDPSASDDVVLPEPDDSGGPGGRITWVGSEDGDLVVHATIANDVSTYYPEADHYAIRVIEGSNDTIVSVQSVEDVTLDWFISRASAEGDGVTVSAPFPILPDLEVCAFWPCKPVKPEPGADIDGDWLSVMMVDATMQLRGQIGQAPLAVDVFENGETVQIADTPLSPDEQLRLDGINAVLFDVATLGPEVELIHSCAKCGLFALGVLAEAGACTVNPGVCAHGYKGAKAWIDECGSGCD